MNVKLREVIFLETIYTCKEYCGSIILDMIRVCCNFLLVSGTTGASHTHLSCGHCTQSCLEWVSIMMPRPGSSQLSSGSSAGHLTPNSKTEHSPACRQTGYLKLHEAHRRLKTHTCCGPAYQREKTQHHPPDCRYQSLPLGRLHELLDQSYPRGNRQQKQGGLWPQTVIQIKWEDREICCRWSCKVKTHKSK